MHSYRYYGAVPRYSPPPRTSFVKQNSVVIAVALVLTFFAISSVVLINSSAISIAKSLTPDNLKPYDLPPADNERDPEIETRLNTTASRGYGPEKAKNFAGYVNVNHSHFFYWFFESRNDPTKDPFILWMTGGPGCSGLFALFNENGPYQIGPSLSLSLNPFSWTSRANVLWVDQPVGTGFSYSDDPNDNFVHTQKEVSDTMYEFLQVFFQSYPEYSKLNLYIFGESYAGHYVPALAKRILYGNERVAELIGVEGMWQGGGNKTRNVGIVLQLQGIAIGDGIVNPFVQLSHNSDYADDHLANILSDQQLKAMREKLPACLSQIKHCAQNSTEGIKSCVSAFDICNEYQILPVRDAGVNYYDIRKRCIDSEPFCYNFSLTTEFLKQRKVQRALGVSGRQWSFCNPNVTENFVNAGDPMLSYQDDIPLLLENQVRVLVYNGDSDFISNWYGAQAWVRAMNWSGAEEFLASPVTEWLVSGQCQGASTLPLSSSPRTVSPPSPNSSFLEGPKDETSEGLCGYFQSAQGLTFVRVREAGHLVPMDQPMAALTLINSFIHNTPLVVLAYLS